VQVCSQARRCSVQAHRRETSFFVRPVDFFPRDFSKRFGRDDLNYIGRQTNRGRTWRGAMACAIRTPYRWIALARPSATTTNCSVPLCGIAAQTRRRHPLRTPAPAATTSSIRAGRYCARVVSMHAFYSAGYVSRLRHGRRGRRVYSSPPPRLGETGLELPRLPVVTACGGGSAPKPELPLHTFAASSPRPFTRAYLVARNRTSHRDKESRSFVKRRSVEMDPRPSRSNASARYGPTRCPLHRRNRQGDRRLGKAIQPQQSLRGESRNSQNGV